MSLCFPLSLSIPRSLYPFLFSALSVSFSLALSCSVLLCLRRARALALSFSLPFSFSLPGPLFTLSAALSLCLHPFHTQPWFFFCFRFCFLFVLLFLFRVRFLLLLLFRHHVFLVHSLLSLFSCLCVLLFPSLSVIISILCHERWHLSPSFRPFSLRLSLSLSRIDTRTGYGYESVQRYRQPRRPRGDK